MIWSETGPDKQMSDFFKISAAIKEKISNPRNILQNLPFLNPPRVIFRKDILSVSKISKYVYLINCPDPVYVSTVFNKEFSFEECLYEKIVLRRIYDSIYFDIQIM